MNVAPISGTERVSGRRKLLRRRAFLAVGLGLPLAVALDAFVVEPKWVRVRTLSVLPPGQQKGHRLAHITDIHHRGDQAYLRRIVRTINNLHPDSVCFTGDIIGDMIDKQEHLDEALDILKDIRCPIYGVPGNHDYWSKLSFAPIQECFLSTGGAWLLDASADTADGHLHIIGLSGRNVSTPVPATVPKQLNVLLMHYPAWVKKLSDKYDLVLAGHSHGGQVRFSFYGAPILPFSVDQYDLGLFQTAAGPLYVNPGLGWFPVKLRFNCRPEITLFHM
jgi:predicted MPP superfamily phosphohydrolase